jgi:hypothetical protein
MEVREFNPYDLDYMDLRPLNSPELHLGGGSLTQYGMSLKAAGEAFTATVDGTPIACIGVFHFWPGRSTRGVHGDRLGIARAVGDARGAALVALPWRRAH